MLQLKKVESGNSSRIQLPQFSGDIKKITLKVTDTNGTAYDTGNGAKTQLVIVNGTNYTATFAKTAENQV